MEEWGVHGRAHLPRSPGCTGWGRRELRRERCSSGPAYAGALPGETGGRRGTWYPLATGRGGIALPWQILLAPPSTGRHGNREGALLGVGGWERGGGEVSLSGSINIYPSIHSSICLFTLLPFICSVHPSIHPFINVPTHPPNHPSLHPPNHPSLHPSTHPSFHPSIISSLRTFSVNKEVKGRE